MAACITYTASPRKDEKLRCPEKATTLRAEIYSRNSLCVSIPVPRFEP